MASAKISKDFTKGNLPKQLLIFTLPFMASNALQVLYSTIDMIIVGEYVGTAGLSAVSQSSLILNFATMVCLGFSNAGQVLLAQAMGAGKRKEMNTLIRDNRVNFVCAADYTAGSEMDTLVKTIIDKIAADMRLERLEPTKG